jgi:hypothetical protein
MILGIFLHGWFYPNIFRHASRAVLQGLESLGFGAACCENVRRQTIQAGACLGAVRHDT